LPARLQPGSALVGWSLGAQLAIAIAARAPQKVSKLVLIAGTTSFIQRDGWPHGMAPEMLADFAAGVAADIEAMLPRFVGGFNRGDARAKSVTSELLELADARPSGAVLATGLNWLRDVDLRPLAPQIKAPTLLIHGANDPLMPLAAAEALAALIPGAELAMFRRLRPRALYFTASGLQRPTGQLPQCIDRPRHAFASLSNAPLPPTIAPLKSSA
jgi:pimeloyl-[acyl-carrier protein] methyl ester esterase